MVSPLPGLVLSLDLPGALDIYRLTLPSTIQGTGFLFQLVSGLVQVQTILLSFLVNAQTGSVYSRRRAFAIGIHTSFISVIIR